MFSENDFGSLKRLGDSQKVQEKIATGKFGLGFSSVSTPCPVYLQIIDLLIGLRMDRFSSNFDGIEFRGVKSSLYSPRTKSSR